MIGDIGLALFFLAASASNVFALVFQIRRQNLQPVADAAGENFDNDVLRLDTEKGERLARRAPAVTGAIIGAAIGACDGCIERVCRCSLPKGAAHGGDGRSARQRNAARDFK